MAQSAIASPIHLNIEGDKPLHKISPTLYGAFFEDINYAADGGLYGELIQNRSFEFAGKDTLYGWSLIERGNPRGSFSVETDRPICSNNPHFLRMQISDVSEGLGIANSGYGGLVLQKGSNYVFSIYARALDNRNATLKVQLENAKNEKLGSAEIVGIGPVWSRYVSIIKVSNAAKNATNAHLVVFASAPGTFDVDVISLFPEHTFNKHRNGLRADLAQMVADMKPSFVRFPGGCIVEGKDLDNRYRWKDTVGAIGERKSNWNRWQSAMPEAPAPQYYQSYGLGFYEYFQFCEDIGAEPLPVLNCGMSCQYQDKQLVPVEALDPFVQDALDLIEFANGPADSGWGLKRSTMGHPEPFNLKYIAIGNEQWGEDYFTRYERFVTVLKAKHPEIQVISSAGPSPNGQWFDMAWSQFKTLPADLVDEHYYCPPSWFLSHSDRYDTYSRTGPKVFAGEYAAHTALKRNNLEAALAEAAFMTGLERNSDVVLMASYAPLLARAGQSQWPVDLIWFNNTQVYGSPSYYVQKMFSVNRGDQALPVQIDDGRHAEDPSGRVVLTTYHTDAEFKEIRVTKGLRTLYSSDFAKGTKEWRQTGGTWNVVEGKYHQSDTATVASAITGDLDWSDYTVTLRARKLGGDEGFIIAVRNSEDGSQVQWNLGGWGNKQHGIQRLDAGQDTIVQRIPGTIENDRWYDIKIELKGTRVNCFLDGALLQSADIPQSSTPRLFATASRDQKSDKIIIKVVNPGSEPASTDLHLSGLKNIKSKAEAIVLSSQSPTDENSFMEPLKVSPVTVPFSGAHEKFHYKFKPYSVTILRIDAER